MLLHLLPCKYFAWKRLCFMLLYVWQQWANFPYNMFVGLVKRACHNPSVKAEVIIISVLSYGYLNTIKSIDLEACQFAVFRIHFLEGAWTKRCAKERYKLVINYINKVICFIEYKGLFHKLSHTLFTVLCFDAHVRV